MAMKIRVFWDIKPCPLVNSYPCFGEVWWLHFQGLAIWAEWTGSWRWSHLIPPDIGNYLPVDMAEHPIRLSSSAQWLLVKSYILNYLNKSDSLHRHKLCTKHFFVLKYLPNDHTALYVLSMRHFAFLSTGNSVLSITVKVLITFQLKLCPLGYYSWIFTSIWFVWNDSAVGRL